MASEINVKQILEEYRNAYPELRTWTDDEILSVINDAAAGVSLNEDERISIFGLNEQGYSGLKVEKESQKTETMDKSSAAENNSNGIGIAALIGGAGVVLAGILTHGKFKAGAKNLQKLGFGTKSAKTYQIPRKIKFETVVTKVNNNPELESNPICKHLLNRFQRQYIPKKEKQGYLTMLDMVAENKILNSNKNLIYLCEKGTFSIQNKSQLKFLEEYINNPLYHNNKHINANLASLTELLGFTHCEKYTKNVIDKFLKNDKSVMSDILKNNIHINSYYCGLPESIIGKELSELNPAELKAVKQWLYRFRESVSDTNLLREFYPSIPSYTEDFPAFVKQIKN